MEIMNNYVILYLATIDNHANEGKSLNILHKKDPRSSFSHVLFDHDFILHSFKKTVSSHDQFDGKIRSVRSSFKVFGIPKGFFQSILLAFHRPPLKLSIPVSKRSL